MIEINMDLLFIQSEFEDRKAALSFLADAMFSQGYVKDDYKKRLLEREDEYPTGLEGVYCNFALSHTDCKFVNKPGLAVATLKKPIEFERMDDDTETLMVDVIFMLALDTHDGHLQFLKTIVELMQSQAFVENLMNSENNEQLFGLLSGKF